MINNSFGLSCQTVVGLETEAEAALNHPLIVALAPEMDLSVEDLNKRNLQKTRLSTWSKMTIKGKRMMKRQK